MGDVMTERMTKAEFTVWLKKRTRAFAVSTFRFVEQLPQTPSGQVIAYQLGKSASSIGANYREASRAESAADFAHKISIVEKEADETFYWLEVIADLYGENANIQEALKSLFQESEELLRLFVSIRKGCKSS